MQKITAFLARSFAKSDEPKIEPIRRHLASFETLGFIVEDAEGANAERVSIKIQKKIDSSDVFIGILTRRHPLYSFSRSWRDAFSVLAGKVRISGWSSPPWVLQEFGYAVKGRLKAILFIESGVEPPGLEGDIEYIPYDPESPAAAITKSGEMIAKIIAERSGIEVETVVNEASDIAVVARTPAPPSPDNPECEVTGEDGNQHESPALLQFRALRQALTDRQFPQTREVLDQAVVLIKQGVIPGDEVFWRSYTYHELAKLGDSGAIQSLKELSESFPEHPDPPAYLGYTLSSYNEHEGAAAAFERAAGLESHIPDKLVYVEHAASSLVELGKRGNAVANLLQAYTLHFDHVTESFATSFFNNLCEIGKKFEAFGVAERVLRSNPTFSNLRFRLGLEYHRAGSQDLFLHHFALLAEHDSSDSSSRHNLALAYSENEMPISSVSTYKKALELGSTKSAANLGFKYLDCGMVQEAKDVVAEAMEKPDHDSQLPRCLSQISEREEAERKKHDDIQQQALLKREFITTYGIAFGSTATDISGKWVFPFAEVDLVVAGAQISGSAKIARVSSNAFYGLSGLANAFLGVGQSSAQSSPAKSEPLVYRVKGNLQGAAARIELETDSGSGSLLAGSDNKIYLVAFSPDGNSGLCSEVTKENVGKAKQIRRL